MHPPSRQLLQALRRAAYDVPIHRIQPVRLLSTSASLYNVPRKAAAPTAPSERQTRQGNPFAPRSTDRGPKSTEDTQTDFGVMDVLANVAAPPTSIDACVPDGFHLDNGATTTGGAGILLVGGEAFVWRPWRVLATGDGSEPKIDDMLGPKNTLNIPSASLKVLELIHPKPDLLLIGTGERLWMPTREFRDYVNETLGCRIDVMDTANASSAYNLLAKERGIDGGSGVGALLLPIRWKGTAKMSTRLYRSGPRRSSGGGR